MISLFFCICICITIPFNLTHSPDFDLRGLYKFSGELLQLPWQNPVHVTYYNTELIIILILSLLAATPLEPLVAL